MAVLGWEVRISRPSEDTCVAALWRVGEDMPEGDQCVVMLGYLGGCARIYARSLGGVGVVGQGASCLVFIKSIYIYIAAY